MPSDPVTLIALDDDDQDLELLRRAVEKVPDWPARLIACSGWEAAREALAASPDAVLILDYVLGDRSGLDVLRELRASDDGRPVLMLTGQGDERTAAETGRAGADDYLPKWGLQPETLREAVETACERARARREETIVAENLQLAQRLQAVTTLVGGIAHDFNNILAVMVGYLELAQERLSDPATRRHLGQVEESCEQMADVIRRLRSLTDHRTADPAPLDLSGLIREVETVLRRVFAPEIEIRLDLPPEPVELIASPSAMRQILQSLANNAADAMAGGGTLTIAAHPLELDETTARSMPGMRPGPHVQLEFRDTGHGMDAETLAHAFEPFFTTRGLSSRRGKGLGLAAVWHAVRSHGGHVSAESRPGEGATFRVLLPKVPTGPIAQRRAAAEQAAAGQG